MNFPFDFEANPLIPAVIQDDVSRDVLMVGFMNRLAFEKTQETGFVHFWSRSRNQLWKKGETSGHTQEVVSMAINCEENSLLIQVTQTGAVCHTGHTTCYYRQILPDGELFETSDPVFDPAAVYQVAPNTETARTTSASMIGAWYGAYEYLAQQPLQNVSGTSRLLHDRVLPFERIADELDELAGVLAGEHSHSGDLKQDVVLEGSQVLYWLNLLAIGTSKSWDRHLQLDVTLFSLDQESERSEQTISDLRAAARRWRAENSLHQEGQGLNGEEFTKRLSGAYQIVSRAVSPVVEPAALVEHDIGELQSKSYLADYFGSVSL
jgi:phosphoribosyl-AMP cyclohydrolase